MKKRELSGCFPLADGETTQLDEVISHIPPIEGGFAEARRWKVAMEKSSFKSRQEEMKERMLARKNGKKKKRLPPNLKKYSAKAKKMTRDRAKYSYWRTTALTPEIEEKILDMVGSGFGIKTIGAQKGLPHWKTIQSWLAKHGDFAAKYLKARDKSVHNLAEKTLSLAEETPKTMLDLHHKKLQIDTLKWWAKVLLPDRYGEVVNINANHSVMVDSVEAANRRAEKVISEQSDSTD
jgi:hypothetical protein